MSDLSDVDTRQPRGCDETPDSREALPLVTVIMPVRNEQKMIARSLGAVLAQHYPASRLEVIVADGESDDDTRQIVSDIARRDARVRLIPNTGRLMPAGFNSALTLAAGDVIVMLGGHTALAPNYVADCVQALQMRKAECVGGPLVMMHEGATDRLMPLAIATAMSMNFGVGKIPWRTGTEREQYVDTVAFGVYTREAIERLGPMDESVGLSHDEEYNYRLRKLGGRILVVPTTRSYYYGRANLHALWRQYFLYGYWKVRVMQKHLLQMRARHFVPPMFVATLIVALASLPFWSSGWLLLGGVCSAYVAANLMASLVTSWQRHDWRLIPFLPVSLLSLHVSYGLGVLVGCVRFMSLWRWHAG